MIIDENLSQKTNENVNPVDGNIKETNKKDIDKETSEKIKNSEFQYSEIPLQEKTERIENTIPMDWKRQTITTVSTTLISFIPTAIKIYNQKKDPSYPALSYDDIVDIIIYKFPDLYTLIEKLTKGGKLENLVTKAKIIKIIFPLIPTIKAFTKHKEHVEKFGFDYILLAHIVTYSINTLIPMIMTNKSINYAYESFLKGTLSNFVIANLLRSRNPLLREAARIFLELSNMFQRGKRVIEGTKNQMNGGTQGNQPPFQNGPINYQSAPGYSKQLNRNNKNVPGKNFIDAIGAGLKIFNNSAPRDVGGVYFDPYGYNYGYQNYPYNNYYYYNQRENKNIWS